VTDRVVNGFDTKLHAAARTIVGGPECAGAEFRLCAETHAKAIIGSLGASRERKPVYSIIIVVARPQPTRLCVDRDFGGLAILRADRFKVSSLAHDLHVRPAVRLQLLMYLILGDRLIAGYEDRAFARFGRDNSDAGYSQQQQAASRQYPSSIHGSSPLRLKLAAPRIT
jgi:hypothetical protein